MKKIFKAIVALLGGALAIQGSILMEKYVGLEKILGRPVPISAKYGLYLAVGIITAIIFYFLASYILKKSDNGFKILEKKMQKRSMQEVMLSVLGLIMGLVVAALISSGPVSLIPVKWIGVIVSILLYLICGYVGIVISSKMTGDFSHLLDNGKKYGNKLIDRDKEKEKSVKADTNRAKPKILDTSVIIDGRIADILRTGFIEGTLVIPVFVLDELRHVSDSADGLKRQRGRRGLDILNKIQKNMESKVEITDKDFPDIEEVDMKLLKLAQTLNGVVVTNDYNLNKVAEFQGVPVWNINELSNAIKPVVLPGEEMTVLVIREGKENAQGLAYLDDGTMIVIENGKRLIGMTIETVVTSVLQTAAGRMIFVKPKADM